MVLLYVRLTVCDEGAVRESRDGLGLRFGPSASLMEPPRASHPSRPAAKRSGLVGGKPMPYPQPAAWDHPPQLDEKVTAKSVKPRGRKAHRLPAHAARSGSSASSRSGSRSGSPAPRATVNLEAALAQLRRSDRGLAY